MRPGLATLWTISFLACIAVLDDCAQGQSADQQAPAKNDSATAPAGEVSNSDPNAELRQKLGQVRQANDGLAKNLQELRLLLDLNICEPATKAKIEMLLHEAALEQRPGFSTASNSIAPAADVPTPDVIATPVQGAQAAMRQAALDASAKPLDRAALVARLNAMTVFVLTPEAFGSGIVVGPNLVLTNRHVIEPSQGKDIFVMNKSAGLALKAALVATTDSSNFNHEDFALLSVQGSLPQMAAQLAPDAQPLDRVIAAGYPGTVISNDDSFRKLLEGGTGDAPDLVLSSGIINTVQNSTSAVPVIVHTAEISPGSSGGPLVNACGQIVGINTFLKQGTGGTARFAIAADVIGRFLAAHQVALPIGPKCASDPS